MVTITKAACIRVLVLLTAMMFTQVAYADMRTYVYNDIYSYYTDISGTRDRVYFDQYHYITYLDNNPSPNYFTPATIQSQSVLVEFSHIGNYGAFTSLADLLSELKHVSMTIGLYAGPQTTPYSSTTYFNSYSNIYGVLESRSINPPNGFYLLSTRQTENKSKSVFKAKGAGANILWTEEMTGELNIFFTGELP